MEQVERVPSPSGTSEGVARSQHLVYTLPHTTDALAQVLAPWLERITVDEASTQLLIVTPDAETAVVVSELVYAMAGPQGIEVVPVTSANRAARLISDRPIHAIAGPPLELQTLVQRSTLRLGSVRTVVLAGIDVTLSSGSDAVASLEALFAELPKEASRIVVARQITPEVEALIERYARNARRIAPAGEAGEATEGVVAVSLQYVTVAPSSRAVTLRRLLDDLDPPSAAVVVRSEGSETDARIALRQLGYRRENDPVRVVRGAVEPGTHTVILFDPPQGRGEMDNAAIPGVVQTIALVTPGELETLRTLAASVVPFTLRAAGSAAREHDRKLREELLGVLEQGTARREIVALEPLLEQYDGIEIAAAALRLLEHARAQHLASAARPSPHTPGAAPSFARGERSSEPRREKSFGDRPKREFSDRPKRDFGDRPKRDFGDRPKQNREFGDQRKRGFGREFGENRPRRDFDVRRKRGFDEDRPKRDFDDRRKRNLGRGPRER